MVLGLRTKNRKGTLVQVDYIIHVQEIKPWPPSQSLRSLRSVLLQWENGEKNSGSLNPSIPSVGTGVGDGKIEFNESFRLTVSLLREASTRGGNADVFQKNCLELNLYEPRRDKTVKGQLLGSVVIDLAEYGIIKESVTFSVPMNCKRSFRNTAQPVMFIKIQPFDKDSCSSSSMESLMKEASFNRDGQESVSALMNEEYAEEAEIASFTDDDVSSHSSVTISASAPEASADLPARNGTTERRLQEENALSAVKDSSGKDKEVLDLPSEPVLLKSAGSVSAMIPSNRTVPFQNGHSSRSSSIDLSSGPMSPEIVNSSISNFPEKSFMLDSKKSAGHSVQSSSSSITYEATEEEVRSNGSIRSIGSYKLPIEVHERAVGARSEMKENNGKPVKEENISSEINDSVESSGTGLQVEEKASIITRALSEVSKEKETKSTRWGINGSEEVSNANGIRQMVQEENAEDKRVENGQTEKIDYRSHLMENEHKNNHPIDCSSNGSSMEKTPVNLLHRASQDAVRKPVASASEQLTFSRRGLVAKGSSFTSDRLNHLKFSLMSPLETADSVPSVVGNQLVEEVKEVDILGDARNGSRSFTVKSVKDVWESKCLGADRVKRVPTDAKNSFSDNKVRELEHRMEILEAELREAAAIELGLYSVVAEHGSSAHKVHAPARRLSRLYIHASKQWSREKRASAARSAVSGLVLVAKACGNDVPRLTFWLSNSVVLRAVITEAAGKEHLPVSSGPHVEISGIGQRTKMASSPLSWKDSPFNKKEKNLSFSSKNDWEDPHTFTAALEKIEAWIFSRIIESVWWQTLTPHMQSSAGVSGQKMGLNSKKSNGRKFNLTDEQHGNFSVNLWKKAFKDACERICPVRAGGHECGCLPLLARLVMEQCVARLDVAMFNAILRESDDAIPTDPISDPICDTKVLPIPAGKSSFGAGAQLKNAIGNWSRWLTDLFGIDDDDNSLEGENENNDTRPDDAANFKAFFLLNALSDLLMLPKDMLLDQSIRKEVCPTFGAPLIKQVLVGFVPDEFCPDPIPEVVLESLDSEDLLEADDESIRNFPCSASPIAYCPPSAASVSAIIGDLKSQSQLRRSGSSVLRKCHTSDDELDELDSPLTSIVIESIPASPITTAEWKSKENSSGSTIRYQLLREVWMGGD